MPLKAVIREFLGPDEVGRIPLVLTEGAGTITLGRAEKCSYKLGRNLGTLGQGISKIQATITAFGDVITLQDGSSEGRSTNGIYCHSERLDGPITLQPGLELTLFKHGLAKVTFIVSDTALLDPHSDTYTGEELLSVLQREVATLVVEVKALKDNNALTLEQLKQRELSDSAQEQRLLRAEKRLNSVVAGILGAVALIVLISGWSGGTLEDRKQWSSTLTAIVIGLGAAYFNAKKNDGQKKEG